MSPFVVGLLLQATPSAPASEIGLYDLSQPLTAKLIRKQRITLPAEAGAKAIGVFRIGQDTRVQAYVGVNPHRLGIDLAKRFRANKRKPDDRFRIGGYIGTRTVNQSNGRTREVFELFRGPYMLSLRVAHGPIDSEKLGRQVMHSIVSSLTPDMISGPKRRSVR